MTLVLYSFSPVSAPKLSTDPISKKHSSPDISGLGSIQPTAMTSTHKCDGHLLDSNWAGKRQKQLMLLSDSVVHNKQCNAKMAVSQCLKLRRQHGIIILETAPSRKQKIFSAHLKKVKVTTSNFNCVVFEKETPAMWLWCVGCWGNMIIRNMRHSIFGTSMQRQSKRWKLILRLMTDQTII